MTKFTQIIGRMTLEQKATLLTANNGWNKLSAGDTVISAYYPSDGVRGLKVSKGLSAYGAPTTSFPSPQTVARSFDTQLTATVADTIAKEARALGVNLLKTPSGALITDARSASSTQISEDAYLSGKMLAAYVRGYEHNGVASCVRVGDGLCGTWLYRDDRLLNDMGIEAYEIALKEGAPSAVELTEGTLKGIKFGESRELIADILKTRWQYSGIINAYDDGALNLTKALSLGVSSLASESSAVECKKLVAAVEKHRQLLTDIEAGAASEAQLAVAMTAGEAIPEILLDEALERLLSSVDGKPSEPVSADGKHSSYPFNHSVVFDEQAHAEKAYRAACESVVLLKNSDATLPISGETKVAIIGEYAFLPFASCRAGEDFVPLDTETSAELVSRSGLNVVGCVKGFSRVASDDAEMLVKQAKELAYESDVVVLFMGNLAETTKEVPQNQKDLISELKRYCNAKIVAVFFGETCDMSWNDECDAVLYAGDLGQGGAKAIYSILNGSVNPSAKLTVGICDDYVSEELKSGLYGYRVCQSKNFEERYPFGYGLSYTRFEYSDIETSESGVSFTLRNVGDRDGAEIVQLYVGRENSRVTDIKKELKGFKKVFLAANESKRVNIPFDSRAFRYYNTDTGSFEREGGFYQIFIASSSRSLELIDEIEIPSSGACVPTGETVVNVEPQKKKIRMSKLIQTVAAGALMLAAAIIAVLYVVLLREEMTFVLNISASDEIFMDIIAAAMWIGGLGVLTVWFVMSVSGIRTADVPDTVAASRRECKPDKIYPDDRDELIFCDGQNETVVGNENESEVGVAEPTVGKYVVERYSAAKAREHGIGKMFDAVWAYEQASGVTVREDELKELLASLAASRLIVVRASDVGAACASLNALADCLGISVSGVSAHENDRNIFDAYRDLIDFIDGANSCKEKMSMAVISGCPNILDMSEYLGHIADYTGSITEKFTLGLGERAFVLPQNMWFVCVVSEEACIDTGNACVVRLRAQTGETGIDALVFDESETVSLAAYELTAEAFAQSVATERENSYLAEKYWKKVDRLVEYLGARVPFEINNKTANAMERFVAVCVGGGAEQTEALDCVISALLLCRIRASQAEAFLGDETLSEFMDSLFGADKDDRCRELVKLKGIK